MILSSVRILVSLCTPPPCEWSVVLEGSIQSLQRWEIRCNSGSEWLVFFESGRRGRRESQEVLEAHSPGKK